MTKTDFLKTTEYDAWDHFVEVSPQGDVFCYSWWLEAVTKNDFQILVVKENQRIVAGIILPFYSAKRVNEPYLTRTIGVLYKKIEVESPRKRLSKERKWLNALLDRVNKDRFVQMCLHHNFTDWLPFRWRGYQQTTRYTYIVDYRLATLEEIWKNISKKRKYSIQKAIKNNLRVAEGGDMVSVYKFSCLSFARQGKKFPYSLKDLQALDDAVRARGKRMIFKVVDASQQIHAMNYVVYQRKSAYHLLIGGDPQVRSMGGLTLLLWGTIKYFSDKVSIFNFGGSDIQPIEEHIRGFGGMQKQYFHIYNEKLFKHEQGLKFHGKKILYHSKEIFKDLHTRSLKEYFILATKLLKYLLKKISLVVHRAD
ncbi:MAG: hypothetical protein HQK76_20385 [Desulfobacterales bacterium]|nr:hypothetical protein [Desulfobacterales bacterium]